MAKWFERIRSLFFSDIFMDVAVVASVTWSAALQIAWNKREYTNMAVVTSCENDLLEGARHHAHTLDSGDKTLGISSVLILKIKSFKYHDKTSCRSVRSVIILVNKQIELALRGRPIFLITRVITDQIGFHSFL